MMFLVRPMFVAYELNFFIISVGVVGGKDDSSIDSFSCSVLAVRREGNFVLCVIIPRGNNVIVDGRV